MKKSIRILAILAVFATIAAPSCKGGGQRAKNKNVIDTTSAVPVTPPIVTYKANPDLNDPARIMAGLPVDTSSALAHWMNDPVWKNYKAAIDNDWNIGKRTLDQVDTLVKHDLTDINEKAKIAFYPFSGPDFAYVDAFLPNVDTYWLLAMEGAGSPITDKSVNGNAFGVYRNALRILLAATFFRTLDMEHDLANATIDGAIPILEFFMVRKGFNIVEVNHLNLEKDGSMTKTDGIGPIAQIKFFKDGEDTKLRTLYYVSCNVRSNLYTPGLSKMLLAHLDRETTATFVKSSSYCMHQMEYDEIRNILLDNSFAVVQDDTGVPYRDFVGQKWNVTLYGGYVHPLRIFAEHCYQLDLLQAYKGPDVKPLPFRLGYNTVSSLMVARRTPETKSVAPVLLSDSTAVAK